MPATATVRRNPGEFGEDLAALARLPWQRIWPGDPGNTPHAWAEGLGLQLDRIDPDEHLAVVLPSGAPVTLFRQPASVRIDEVLLVLWQVRAGRAIDNSAVVEAATDAWPHYLTVAQSALGPATWSTDTDGSDLSTAPAAPWTTDQPPSAAVWTLPDGGTAIALWLGLAGTGAASRPGSASIRLAVTPAPTGG